MSNKALSKIKLAAQIYPRYLAYRVLGKVSPMLVTFGITNRCNLRCKYCFAALDNREQKDLPA